MTREKAGRLSGIFTVLVLLSACDRNDGQNGVEGQPDVGAKVSTGKPCDNWISGKQARDLIDGGGVLLDVRTAEEFALGHIDGALNIQVNELSARLSELSREKPVVVYCQSGRRAHQAALLLKDEGYKVSEIGTQAQYSPDAPAGCHN